jgi:two-component system cell cycle response regulator DivK
MPKILVVEDDPNSAHLVERVLTRHGFEVHVEHEGLSGLNYATTNEIDLILMDINLPDIAGYTAAALIRRLPNSVPVVAVSANADPVTKQKALNSGCKGYITKPINTRTFGDEVASFLPEPSE